jgi:hypothetical protein
VVTKRQLGIFAGAAGVVVMLGLVGVDLLGAGQFGGFGPLQRLGVLASIALVAVGMILYRLGDRPA